MASTGKSALGGAATGASLGSTIPGIGTAIGAGVGAVVGTVASLFKSKKHYHLYYFEPADGQWHFVMDGIPSQVKPIKKQYAAAGYNVVLVRNKGGKYQPGELAPKNPPAGAATAASKNPLAVNWIPIAIIGGVVLVVVFFLLKKRRK